MKIIRLIPAPLRAQGRSFATLFVLAALLFASGCVTQRAVKDIVAESNMASLSEEWMLGAENPSKPNGTNGWKAASAKIEAFIAAHPENKVTIAALRVRQGVLLLNNKQYHLAEAAFDQVKVEDLRASSRDRALKQLQPELLWWYPTAGGSLPTAEYRTASNALVRITAVRAGLTAPEEEGIRDWLAALRAWIALKMANDADNDALGANASRRFLEDGINTYAAMLPAGEAARWQQETNFPPEGMSLELAFGGANRRRFRADDLIKGAQTAMRQNAISSPQITEEYFRTRLVP